MYSRELGVGAVVIGGSKYNFSLIMTLHFSVE